jgi:uncharacterized membrane protein
VLAAAPELGTVVGGVETARTLLQRGVRMNSERAELALVELSLFEGLRRCWGVLGITTSGKSTGVDDEEREEAMRGVIVMIHGNMADVTWLMVALLPALMSFLCYSRDSGGPLSCC